MAASHTAALTLAQVAARAGVSAGTVRRWVGEGLIPQYNGGWGEPAARQVGIVARLRERGYTLEQIREASDSGRLALGDVEDFLSGSEGRHTLRQAARETGLAPELIERIFVALGLSALATEAISDEDLEMLRYVAAVLEAGMPEVAFVQIARVYGQALAQIAEAEVRLIRMYIHEPLMRDGMSGQQIAEQMDGIARELLPFTVPLMNFVHGRSLSYFLEQELISHMEAGLGAPATEAGRLRVAIAFADLAGYTRLTEEQGDEQAVSAVERFVEAVERTLPIDARVFKMLGDEVMVVAADPVALVLWAVGFQARAPAGVPPPRIGIHYGEAIYRDGDYYGREINQAARVVARAAGGEVLVTRAVVDLAEGVAGLAFKLIGEVGLKGFSEPTELFLASAR
ncbi:MAG TPA: adenylate cyclase regulatory domain-containing protein [Solirubrobacteraceae bacterium]|jgi:adenylate cyclase|nr:adenylate cyclase regulatory domain-containing protein [Solirubrobacteraceae bacterium]